MKINAVQNVNIPVKRVIVPHFYGNTTNPVLQDTAEINSKNKNNDLWLNLFLGALGIGVTIFALTKFCKTRSVKAGDGLSAELKEVRKLYKDIFKRDINAEETKDFAERYKKIIESKTPDNDREYCEKLLDEICKDRQTKRPKILRWITNRANIDPECRDGLMSTSPDGTYVDIYIYNYHDSRRFPVIARDLFESLFHETHHVKQDEIIYRTDKEFFLQHIMDKFVHNGEGVMYKEMLQNNGGNVEKTLNEIRQGLSNQIERYWGSFEPFAKDSAEYKEGLRLIEGKKNYKFFGDCRSYEEYKNQTIESGAFADEEKASKLFNLLKKITL